MHIRNVISGGDYGAARCITLARTLARLVFYFRWYSLVVAKLVWVKTVVPDLRYCTTASVSIFPKIALLYELAYIVFSIFLALRSAGHIILLRYF